jgi:hypothetical protein
MFCHHECQINTKQHTIEKIKDILQDKMPLLLPSFLSLSVHWFKNKWRHVKDDIPITVQGTWNIREPTSLVSDKVINWCLIWSNVWLRSNMYK